MDLSGEHVIAAPPEVVWARLLDPATLNPDLAYAARIDPKREELILTLALALVVAATVAGRLARMGEGLVRPLAQSAMDRFFDRFAAAVTGDQRVAFDRNRVFGE